MKVSRNIQAFLLDKSFLSGGIADSCNPGITVILGNV
jgi:hypothetical protein